MSQIQWSIIMAWKMKRPLFAINYTVAILKDWWRNRNET